MWINLVVSISIPCQKTKPCSLVWLMSVCAFPLQGKEDKSRRYEGHDESGRPVKRQNLAGKEVRASPTLVDPSEESDSEVRELPLTTSRQGIMKSSKPCSSGSRLESKALVLRGGKKTKSLRELPAGPMNEPSVPGEVHKKGLTKLSSSEKQVNDLALSKKPVSAVHPGIF